MDGRPSELKCHRRSCSNRARMGYTTPVNEFLYAILLPMEINTQAKSKVVRWELPENGEISGCQGRPLFENNI